MSTFPFFLGGDETIADSEDGKDSKGGKFVDGRSGNGLIGDETSGFNVLFLDFREIANENAENSDDDDNADATKRLCVGD